MKVTHTGENPFACTKCDKTFKLNGELKMYQKTHTGEKPFDCSECEKAYSQKVHLKSHLPVPNVISHSAQVVI